MAGGKGTRMRTSDEKPMLHVGNRPMIVRVIEAMQQSESVNRIIVVVSANSKQTERAAMALGVEVVKTAGKGYEHDMKQAIKSLALNDVVVVSSDLPFLSSKIVDEATSCYFSRGKPALMVAAPVELHKRFGMEPSYAFEMEGGKLAPIGINIINGRRIDEPRLDETVFVTEAEDLIFNVNTPNDLEIARTRSTQN